MVSFFRDDVTITLSPQDVADTVTFDAQGAKYEGPDGTIGSRLIRNMAIRYNVAENFATDEGVIPGGRQQNLIVKAVCKHRKNIFFVLNTLGDLQAGKDVQFGIVKSTACGCDNHFKEDYQDLSESLRSLLNDRSLAHMFENNLRADFVPNSRIVNSSPAPIQRPRNATAATAQQLGTSNDPRELVQNKFQKAFDEIGENRKGIKQHGKDIKQHEKDIKQLRKEIGELKKTQNQPRRCETVTSNMPIANLPQTSGANLNVPAINVENHIAQLEMDMSQGNHNQTIQRCQAELAQLKLQYEQDMREAREKELATHNAFMAKMANIEAIVQASSKVNDVILKAAQDQQKFMDDLTNAAVPNNINQQ